jgi:antitoxin (DNA-binding transcriptional repressor) of toxin-antitoxin stability system
MNREVIHVSDSEAVSDFSSLLARVRKGIEAIIEHNGRAIAVLAPARIGPGRRLSESIALAEEHACSATLDGGFEKDLDQVLKSHREPLSPPVWE